MPRYWIKFLGGRDLLEDLVGIAPSNYGTKLDQVDFKSALGITDPCPACTQQRADSEFIERLNAGDDTPGQGSFTQIATDDDEIIPCTNCFLKGDERTKDVILRRFTNDRPITHQNIYNDPGAQRLVFDALANPGPANPRRAFG